MPNLSNGIQYHLETYFFFPQLHQIEYFILRRRNTIYSNIIFSCVFTRNIYLFHSWIWNKHKQIIEQYYTLTSNFIIFIHIHVYNNYTNSEPFKFTGIITGMLFPQLPTRSSFMNSSFFIVYFNVITIRLSTSLGIFVESWLPSIWYSVMSTKCEIKNII
jgi:hypothetical protein